MTSSLFLPISAGAEVRSKPRHCEDPCMLFAGGTKQSRAAQQRSPFKESNFLKLQPTPHFPPATQY